MPTSFDGHFGHIGHFVALPHTGENKSSEIYKNEENKNEIYRAGVTDVPKVPKVPISKQAAKVIRGVIAPRLGVKPRCLTGS